MSDSPLNDLEVLRIRSEELKKQATDLFDQARDLDAKIRYYEQLKKQGGSNSLATPAKRPE